MQAVNTAHHDVDGNATWQRRVTPPHVVDETTTTTTTTATCHTYVRAPWSHGYVWHADDAYMILRFTHGAIRSHRSS